MPITTDGSHDVEHHQLGSDVLARTNKTSQGHAQGGNKTRGKLQHCSDCPEAPQSKDEANPEGGG